MRGHRAKQYRKLMHQYNLLFSFREPYQILVDAQIVQDAASLKYDLLAGLKRTLQGEIKPMITQCSMRHLYSTKNQAIIQQAQTLERRRCNHHELEEPLPFAQCLKEVVDGKSNNTNKHRYIVATQDADVRADMRRIPGVPLIYISRSVMVLEPMANATIKARARGEREKLRTGLIGARGRVLGKRSRDEGNSDSEDDAEMRSDGSVTSDVASAGPPMKKAKKKHRGPKGPNPLSVKKAKATKPSPPAHKSQAAAQPAGIDSEPVKRKRKRRRKGHASAETLELESKE